MHVAVLLCLCLMKNSATLARPIPTIFECFVFQSVQCRSVLGCLQMCPRPAVWCSGVKLCQTEDETIISSCCDNGAPVVMGTEGYEGRRREEEEERDGGGGKVCWRNQ